MQNPTQSEFSDKFISRDQISCIHQMRRDEQNTSGPDWSYGIVEFHAEILVPDHIREDDMTLLMERVRTISKPYGIPILKWEPITRSYQVFTFARHPVPFLANEVALGQKVTTKNDINKPVQVVIL